MKKTLERVAKGMRTIKKITKVHFFKKLTHKGRPEHGEIQITHLEIPLIRGGIEEKLNRHWGGKEEDFLAWQISSAKTLQNA